MPTFELVMAGYNHLDFATPGSEQKHRDLSYFIEAWLDRWVGGDVTADSRLLADTVLGAPTTSLLSERFLSGAFLPGEIDTADYRAYLADTTAPETTKRQGGPKAKVTRKPGKAWIPLQLRLQRPDRNVQLPVRRRPSAGPAPRRSGSAHSVPAATRCGSEATDSRGNVEAKPAVWKFRVLR